MSQLPLRNIRLIGRPTSYYQRLVGQAGELYYDNELQTLRIYQGNIADGKIIADRDWVSSVIATYPLPASPAAGIYPGSATALDLTKQVQILTADVTNNGYFLADGEEGQIMYFVPAANAGVYGIYVSIANARIIDTSSSEIFTEPEYSWNPFLGATEQPTTIAMAIFANGAWCLRGGVSD